MNYFIQPTQPGVNISSGDTEATRQIGARLDGLKRNHDQMKLANRYLRSGNDAGLKQMGFDETQIASLKKPDMLGRVGFDDGDLKNSTATIARLEKRLQVLSANCNEVLK